MVAQPRARRAVAGRHLAQQAPVGRGVVGLQQMADLVGDDVVEHRLRRQQQPPRVGEPPRGRAAAPAAARVADPRRRNGRAQAGGQRARARPQHTTCLAPVPALDDPVQVAARPQPRDQAAAVAAGRAAAGRRPQGQLQAAVEQGEAVTGHERRGRRPQARPLLGHPTGLGAQEPLHLAGAGPRRDRQAHAGGRHPQRHAPGAAVPHHLTGEGGIAAGHRAAG